MPPPPRRGRESVERVESESNDKKRRGEMNEDEVGDMLSRFDSSQVSMLDKQTLCLIGPDGKKEFFIKVKQMGRMTKQDGWSPVKVMPTLEGAPSSTYFISNAPHPLLFAPRYQPRGFEYLIRILLILATVGRTRPDGAPQYSILLCHRKLEPQRASE